MPSALAVEQAWIPLCAFVTGGLAFILMDKLMDLIKERFSGSDSTTGSAWGIYFGVAIDLFSDGIMIGSGSTVAISLGLLLALGQIPADIPEGFATIATFKRKGVSKKLRYFLAIGFVVPIFLGATIGYWAVRDSPEIVQLSLLAFTAGILVTVAIEEMITEAHEKPDSTYASFFLTAGFALFAFIAVYMEG